MLFSPTFLPPLQDGVTKTSTIPESFPQNIPGWPTEPIWLDFLLTALLFTTLSLLVYWLLFSLLRNIAYRNRNRADDILLTTVRTPLLIFLVAFGILRSLEVLDLDHSIDDFLVTSFAVVLIATTFILAWRIVREVVLRWLRHHANETENRVDDLLVPMINTLGPLFFVIAAVATILSFLGIDVSLFLVSIGAVGLIIGLAFQESLSNLFSGIYLLLNPPFHENDMIQLSSGKLCTVQRVGLRMTQLYDLDENAITYVPNNKLAGEIIINITKPTVEMAGIVKLRTVPNADPDHVKGLLNDILLSHRNIVGVPAQKISTLRKRIEAIAADSGQSADELKKVLADLATWDRVSDEREATVHQQLQAVRVQMNGAVDRAQEVLRTLQAARSNMQRDVKKAIETLSETLRQAPSEANVAEVSMDESRMTQLSRAFEAVVEAIEGEARNNRVDLTPLTAAMAQIGDLDERENALEATLAARQKERDQQFTTLTATLQVAAEHVATALNEKGRFKEAKSISLWTDNLIVAYAEQEVDYTVDGLDRELDGLITWLHELEGGGIDRDERRKIRTMFNGWGGVTQVEQRRVDELRRRVLRWQALKEEESLARHEYQSLIDTWERRLRTLSRKIRESREGDEEALDNRLQAIREWIRSQDFREPTPDWKLSGGGFSGWGDFGLDFAMYYYVDDIRLNHYARRGIVGANLRMDVYDVFKREKIEVPFSQHDIRIHGAAVGEPEGNGHARMPSITRLQPPTQ